MRNATSGAVMAKRKATRNDVAQKLDAEVVRIAKIVAAYRDVSVPDYLSELLRPLVQRDLENEQAKAAKAKPPK